MSNKYGYRKNFSKFLVLSLVINLFVALSVFILLFAKAETKQGISYKVHSFKIPLYVKVFGIFQRDYEYRRIAQMIVGTEKDEQKIVEKILKWTDKFIVGEFPKSFPIYDDHILNIIHRGYGTKDQRIDVATTLSTYAGVMAFWDHIFDNKKRIMISYFQVNRLWRVFEPHEWSFFYTSSGEWATIQDLQKYPEYIVIDNQVPMHKKEVSLVAFYKNLKVIEAPPLTRAESQMPFKRFKHEIFKMINRL